jgi:hypothetical protein
MPTSRFDPDRLPRRRVAGSIPIGWFDVEWPAHTACWPKKNVDQFPISNFSGMSDALGRLHFP